jgi:AcrR family transcriptional regulator
MDCLMARKRSIADEVLLDGALAVMRRDGPDAITFQAVATQTGLAASTLVQRFGTKPKLKRAALVRAWDRLDAATAAADAAAALTPAGAIDLLVALSAGYGEGAAYVEGLQLLGEDFRDPVLRRRGAAWGNRLAEHLGRRLGPGRGSASALGTLMAAQWQGVILWWGFHRRGRLKSAVGAALTEWCRAVGKAPAPRR